MTMSINGLMQPAGADLFYSQPWHLVVETHLNWLKTRNGVRVLEIEAQDGYKYEADLNGLLSQYQQPPEFHWIIMRMNDMTSPSEYRGDRLQLLIPDRGSVDAIRSVFTTSNKKIN